MVTTPIRNVQAEVARLFPSAADWGDQHCRKIAGSSRWSQHAWGNAWDIAGPKPLLDEIYDHLNRNRRRLSLAVICWEYRGPCNAATHMDHIHIEAAPRMTGTPPCAGGTDSRPIEDDATGDTAAGAAFGDIGQGAAAAVAGDALRQALGIPEGMTWQRFAVGAAGLLAIIFGIVFIFRDTAGNIARTVVADVTSGA